MPVEDVFSISGRGTVVTGRVDRGIVKVGEEVEIVGYAATQKKGVTGVERLKNRLDAGEAPGSITRPTRFGGEVYVLTKDEGGRHTPFFNGYRPQFYLRTTDVTGV